MGFYLRKSIRVGPFRFNLSKSGVGVSAGIKGLRVGTGPRGNYIHMGAGGLYYRKTLPSSPASKPAMGNTQRHEEITAYLNQGHSGFQEIESQDIAQMTDSSSAELLAEFDQKRKKMRLWPWVGVLGALAFWMAMSAPQPQSWAPFAIIGLTLVLMYATSVYDQIRKSVVLFYDLEPLYEGVYDNLHSAFEEMKKTRKAWHVEAQADVTDRKRHAGATQLIKKTAISFGTDNPPYVKTNVTVPSIPVGKQTLFLFPDRILVFESNKVGAIAYKDLDVEITPTRFIEADSVPSDAQVVDRTWRYVNKKGGPDKRFSNNRELPICMYEDMHLKSRSGLNELVEFSRLNSSADFKRAIAGLADPHAPGSRLSVAA